MIKKIILTDIDGVCVDWNAGFMHFMAREGYAHNPKKHTSYSIAERHDVTESLAYDYLEEYCKSETIANLQPIKHSVEVIERLHEQGYEFIGITNLGEHENCLKHRTTNLNNLYGNAFTKIHCLKGGSDKKPILSQYRNVADIWVEDQIDNANDGFDLGFRAFLMDQPYNSYYAKKDISAFRVIDWLEIEHWINDQTKIWTPGS